MAYQISQHRQWQLKSWHYKRCSKCAHNTKYEHFLDLYVLKDTHATWICGYCQYPETISTDELLSRYDIQ